MAEGMHVVEGNTEEAIQLVIDLASGEGGGVVFLPAQVYLLGRSIQLRSNVRLVGAGEATVLRIDGSVIDARNVNAIELHNDDEATVHDIEISHLTIRGPGSEAVPARLQGLER